MTPAAPVPPTAVSTTEPDVRAKTLRGLLLACELDAARRARRLSTRALASRAAMSPAMLNRVMTGRRVPTALEIGGLCGLLEIHPHRRRILYRLAAEAAADLTDWIINPDPRSGVEEGMVGQIETISETIFWFAPALLPHPLRTPAYDHAVTGKQSTYEPVSARTLRISMFLLHPHALLDAGVPETVLDEQIQHLLINHVGRIRLLPDTIPPHPGFRIMEMRNFPPVVTIDHHDTTILLENPVSTAAHSTFLRQAKAMSRTEDETRQALDGLLLTRKR